MHPDKIENMTKALKGINLGGWLVAERWMTPDLFEGVAGDGEIALVTELGFEEAKQRLKKHRDSFITEQDLKWIKEHGFDFVRLPVGYWLFEQTDDFIDGETYLKRAFEWAAAHHLGVVLDFHGLQGSQNGHDHSGQVGKVRLYRHGNRKRALQTLTYMCRTYGHHESLIGIEVINEPKVRWLLWRLFRYYDQAIAVVECYTRPDIKIIISDAFKPLRAAKALARRGYSKRVVLDVHLYQLFNPRYERMSFDEHVVAVDEWKQLLEKVNHYTPVLIGEWSAALPPAAREDENDVSMYYQSQQKLFAGNAWAESYWSYKVPGAGLWDYQSRSSFHSEQ